MPGKRITNPSLINTTFPEAVANSAELLTDWNGLVWARPIPISLIGNSWFQGSYDSIVWDNYIKDDHNYLQVSTDGGITWRLIDLTGSGDDHPPVTIGTPDGGLVISGDDTQILTLNPVNYINGGHMIPYDKWKLDQLKIDYLANLDTGFNIYKDFTDNIDGLTRTHNLRPLVGGVGITLSYVGDTIVITGGDENTGQANTGANVGSLGVGPYDGMNGEILNFRNFHSAGDILTVTLDDVLNNIALEIVEANIDHNVLENYVINEHIDHSTVSILTEEGIKGGGDITTTRTLSLDFPTLTSKTTIADTDIFALYSVDEHFKIAWSDFKLEIKEYTDTFYVPLTRGVFTNTGLTGGGLLTSNRTIGLAFNDLPTVSFDPATDYLAIYDGSNGNHAKILLSSVTSVNITEGNGMDFTAITSTGTIDMALPLTVTDSTTNSAGTPGTGHTHALTIAELISIVDVDDSPVSGEYLKWNGTAWVTDDPSVGASTPGAPLNSIQFNDTNTFAGNAGLLYYPDSDTIFFSPQATSDAYLYFGDTSLFPYIYVNSSGSTFEVTNPIEFGTLGLNAGQLLLGVSVGVDSFLTIQDSNITSFDNIINVYDNTLTSLLILDKVGKLYLPELTSAVEDNILYFDIATGLITYGAKPTTGGGGILTLTADIVSGLTVNGGSTSSASTIDLDVNDSRLAVATIALDDIIGFWDVNAVGEYKQRRTTLAEFPGWLLSVDGGTPDEFKFGSQLNIAAGNNVTLNYNDVTNLLTINATGEGGTGDYPDLYINGSLMEENFPTINFIEGTNISIDYSAPGGVTISADPYFPPYTHIPKAFIASNRVLYTYDITEGTAQRLLNAPNSNWNNKTSFGLGDDIFTCNGTTLYKYNISTDTTTSVEAGDSDIVRLIRGSDNRLYTVSPTSCYYINPTTMISTFYGKSNGGTQTRGLIEVKRPSNGKNYLVTFNDSEDRFYYKEIKETYSGADSTGFTTGPTYLPNPPGIYCNIWATDNFTTEINGSFVTSPGNQIVLFDIDNVTVVWDSFDDLLAGSSNRIYTYTVPSAHWNFSGTSADAIATSEVTQGLSLDANRNIYSIVSTTSGNGYSGYEANLDRGLYLSLTNNGATQDDFDFKQVINENVYDVHVEYIVQGLFDIDTNVMVGGEGRVHFKAVNEDVSQFTTKDVYEVDFAATHAIPITLPITFVYFNDTYTSGGIPPKDITVVTAYPIEDIAFDFNDVTGEIQSYILDIEASYNYTIIEAVLQSDATVAVTIDIDATTTITDDVTTAIGTYTSGDSVVTGNQVTLNLATSSATLIRGKLRIKRV